jgi:ribosomal protein S18 acetylase RimI-like enzyme
MIAVRPARAEDDPSLAAIDAAAWSVRVTPGPARESATPFFNDRTQPESVLVAEADGVVAGYVMLHQSIPLPSHEHVLEVNGLAVDPEQQGRGIGRRLIEEAKAAAVRRGARKLNLRVLAPNDNARRLYEACGFTVEGVLVGEFLLEGHLVDDVLMACRLGQAD